MKRALKLFDEFNKKNDGLQHLKETIDKIAGEGDKFAQYAADYKKAVRTGRPTGANATKYQAALEKAVSEKPPEWKNS